MPSTSALQIMDRLSVRSVMRGSTSTICGLLGTLAVIILCLAIYIPPTVGYFNGNYFQSEFFTQDQITQDFYSTSDFKIAVQFRYKKNNTVADHKVILNWAYSEFYQVFADRSAYFLQPSSNCRRDYLADAINPVELQDCFIFPQNTLYRNMAPTGWYAGFKTQMAYWLYPHNDDNPFSGINGGNLMGNEYLMNQLFSNYYFVVYFTSKIIDSRYGKPQFQVNRYYSTDSNFQTQGSTSWDTLIYSVKKYNLDISIMPWANNITANTLIWLGQQRTTQILNTQDAASYGAEVDFQLDRYNIVSYRYYKKLDWLLGIIGGAMLMFYIILWVPCNYISRVTHQIQNVNQLLLIDHSLQGQSITDETVTAANVSKWYWLSNPLVDLFSTSTSSASKLVKAGDKELDIVSLIKKIKIVERTLKKKEIYQVFKPKILKMRSISALVVVDRLPEEASSVANDNLEQRSLQPRQQVIEQIVEEDFVELPVDPTYNLTQPQLNALQNQRRMDHVYENNLTANVIMGNQDQTTALMEMHSKSRFKAKYGSKRKVGKLRKLINCIAQIIRYFDFFGVRPNLISEPYNSSFMGCCGVMLILGMTLLVVILTLNNASTPQLMVLNEVKKADDIDYSLQSGQSLKFAVCFSLASYIKGTTKWATLRFFTENQQKGRQYYPPRILSTGDYSEFDLTADTAPTSFSYCFTMPSGVKVQMEGQKGESKYFGFRLEPYCASSASFCQSNSATITGNFLKFMNSSLLNLNLPENRFDPNSTKFISSLVGTTLNINYRYMKNTTSMEETLFVDQVRIVDDTKNWFARKEPTVLSQGITNNENTAYPQVRNLPSGGNPYYEVKIKPSNNQINYFVTTPKADTILGIIGGVFVLWYAIFHWIGKIYNNFNVRSRLAEQIYDEQTYKESLLNKWLTILPVPSCLLPSCFNIRIDVIRMRQIQKKIQNDLHYLWLIRYVNSMFQLSSAFFEKIQAKNLSLVFVKEKIDEGSEVKQAVQAIERVEDSDFINFHDDDDENNNSPGKKSRFSLQKQKSNKIVNQSFVPEPSYEDLNEMNQKLMPKVQSVDDNGVTQNFQDNYVHGNPKQPRFNWLDTFEYPATFTFKGQREITSCCGGCCCLIMLILIIIIASFQVGIYLNRSDARIGMSTEMMQPLKANSNSTYNSEIHLLSGQNFKLAVTFSSAYQDYPQDVTNWTSSGIGVSVFQEIYSYSAGAINTQSIEIPMVKCRANYLTQWMNPLMDPAYYQNTQLGYCLPDGITLEIDGIPEDPITKRFILSIYNKDKTDAGNLQVKQFMQIYLPKIHVSNPIPDFSAHKFNYQIASFVFDSFNVTYRMSQNISLSKTSITYDDQIAFQGQPFTDISYSVSPFQQYQTYYIDGNINSYMSYNLTFANSYQVERYNVKGDKFYQTFGIIGGLVALFIFGLGCFARSFNQYRMRYLIGRELYLFDLLKIKQARAAARGRKRKTRQQLLGLSDANNMSEGQVFIAYLSSYIAAVTSNYNINDTLRRVTLIQQKVEKDLSIYQVYKKVHNMRDIINKQFPWSPCPISDIHLKQIYNPDPDDSSLVNQNRILSFAKKHNWSSFQQYAVFEAAMASINLKTVFDNQFLERELNMAGIDRSSVHLSQFGGTQGSIGTNSIAEGSQLHRQSQIIQEQRIQQ